MSHQQQADPSISLIRDKLMNGSLKDQSFVIDIKDNNLYKIIDYYDRQFYDIYLPEKFVDSIITEYHCSPFSGHLGINATYDKIRKNIIFQKC